MTDYFLVCFLIFYCKLELNWALFMVTGYSRN